MSQWKADALLAVASSNISVKDFDFPTQSLGKRNQTWSKSYLSPLPVPTPPPPLPQKRGIIPLLYFNSNISVIPIPLFLFRPPTTPPTTRDTKTLNKTNEYPHPRRQSLIESQVYIYCVTNYRVARNFMP